MNNSEQCKCCHYQHFLNTKNNVVQNLTLAGCIMSKLIRTLPSIVFHFQETEPWLQIDWVQWVCCTLPYPSVLEILIVMTSTLCRFLHPCLQLCRPDHFTRSVQINLVSLAIATLVMANPKLITMVTSPQFGSFVVTAHDVKFPNQNHVHPLSHGIYVGKSLPVSSNDHALILSTK